MHIFKKINNDERDDKFLINGVRMAEETDGFSPLCIIREVARTLYRWDEKERSRYEGGTGWKRRKKKKRKEKEEGWLKWWRGNRLEKCREDRKIVKNDAPRWTGRTDSYCFPTHFPNAGKLTEFLGWYPLTDFSQLPFEMLSSSATLEARK